MKKYQFKMQKVLELKRLRETLQLKELGEEVKNLNVSQAKVDESRALKHQFDQKFHQVERVGRLDAMNFRLHQSYSLVLGQEIVRGELEVEDQKNKVDQVRERVRLAHRETKSFEMLKEKSFKAYQAEYRKEEEKELNEVGIRRSHLRSAQSGQALLMLMAIGSTAFLMFLLTLGLMFATGNLTPDKLTLIFQIIQYDQDYTKSYLVVGQDKPYVVSSDKYLKMEENAEKFVKWQDGTLENEVVITQEILDHRKNLLDRLERNILRIRDDIKTKSSDVKNREERLASGQAKLSDEIAEFEGKKDDKKKENMKKAQAQMLQSFNAMDPEDVVNVLTGGKTAQQLVAPEERKNAVNKLTSYLSQMSARQRAGVLQALDPELATDVVRNLETQSL